MKKSFSTCIPLSTRIPRLVALAGYLVHNATLELMTNPGMTRNSPSSIKLKIDTLKNNKEIFAILKTKFNESSKANK